MVSWSRDTEGLGCHSETWGLVLWYWGVTKVFKEGGGVTWLGSGRLYKLHSPLVSPSNPIALNKHDTYW